MIFSEIILYFTAGTEYFYTIALYVLYMHWFRWKCKIIFIRASMHSSPSRRYFESRTMHSQANASSRCRWIHSRASETFTFTWCHLLAIACTYPFDQQCVYLGTCRHCLLCLYLFFSFHNGRNDPFIGTGTRFGESSATPRSHQFLTAFNAKWCIYIWIHAVCVCVFYI